MSSSHLAGRQLIGSDASWLIPAHRPTGLAVVFVHGYGGDAVRAWSEFDLLLPAQEQTRGADVVFYGYDARWSELIASTALFEEFLDALATDPASILNSCLAPAHARPAVFRYDELIVCAHSLGAVLARGALLHATQDGKSWPARVKTVLYAPAHSGARVDRLIGQGYSLFKYFGAGLLAFSFASPLIEQLAPGSADLTDLASQTGAAIEGGQRHLTAALILIAEREHIVLNRPMCRQDPRPIPVAGATHRSVCKPRAEKRAALDSLPEGAVSDARSATLEDLTFRLLDSTPARDFEERWMDSTDHGLESLANLLAFAPGGAPSDTEGRRSAFEHWLQFLDVVALYRMVDGVPTPTGEAWERRLTRLRSADVQRAVQQRGGPVAFLAGPDSTEHAGVERFDVRGAVDALLFAHERLRRDPHVRAFVNVVTRESDRISLLPSLSLVAAPGLLMEEVAASAGRSGEAPQVDAIEGAARYVDGVGELRSILQRARRAPDLEPAFWSHHFACFRTSASQMEDAIEALKLAQARPYRARLAPSWRREHERSVEGLTGIQEYFRELNLPPRPPLPRRGASASVSQAIDYFAECFWRVLMADPFESRSIDSKDLLANLRNDDIVVRGDPEAITSWLIPRLESVEFARALGTVMPRITALLYVSPPAPDRETLEIREAAAIPVIAAAPPAFVRIVAPRIVLADQASTTASLDRLKELSADAGNEPLLVFTDDGGDEKSHEESPQGINVVRVPGPSWQAFRETVIDAFDETVVWSGADPPVGVPVRLAVAFTESAQVLIVLDDAQSLAVQRKAQQLSEALQATAPDEVFADDEGQPIGTSATESSLKRRWNGLSHRVALLSGNEATLADADRRLGALVDLWAIPSMPIVDPRKVPTASSRYREVSSALRGMFQEFLAPPMHWRQPMFMAVSSDEFPNVLEQAWAAAMSALELSSLNQPRPAHSPEQAVEPAAAFNAESTQATEARGQVVRFPAPDWAQRPAAWYRD